MKQNIRLMVAHGFNAEYECPKCHDHKYKEFGITMHYTAMLNTLSNCLCIACNIQCDLVHVRFTEGRRNG